MNTVGFDFYHATPCLGLHSLNQRNLGGSTEVTLDFSVP